MHLTNRNWCVPCTRMYLFVSNPLTQYWLYIGLLWAICVCSINDTQGYLITLCTRGVCSFVCWTNWRKSTKASNAIFLFLSCYTLNELWRTLIYTHLRIHFPSFTEYQWAWNIENVHTLQPRDNLIIISYMENIRRAMNIYIDVRYHTYYEDEHRNDGVNMSCWLYSVSHLYVGM